MNELNNNFIICGDALSALKKIRDNSVHMVITSPPYNVAHNYDNFNDDMSEKEYNKFILAILKQLHRVLVSGGRLAINVPFAVKNKNNKKVTFLATRIADMCNKVGFLEFEFITWHKGKNLNHFQGNNTAWGSWKSPSNPVFRPLGEVVMIFSKEKTKLDGSKELIDISSEEFKEWTKNLWYFDEERDIFYENLICTPNTSSKSNHPCPFPEELVERLVKLYTYKDNVILDPFNGLGTTSFVAKKNSRQFIGIDQSHKYCAIAAQRISMDIDDIVYISEN